AAKHGTRLEWAENTAKIITGPLPATGFDEENDRKTWFNSLAVAYRGPATEKTNSRDKQEVIIIAQHTRIIQMGTENFFREVELPEQNSQDNGVLFPAVLSPNSGNEYLTASE
ncbi:hypothetical protein R6Q59_000232, partial [Mikania micrantha]